MSKATTQQPLSAKAAAKKRVVKVDSYGDAHITASFNNIIISLTNKNGQVISWSSAGKMGFKGSKKNTPYAAQMAAERASDLAKEYGIKCYELIGWNNGGLERNYPLYEPEEKMGGHTEFKNLLNSITERGDHCLVFTNYNILDKSTDWYKQELYKYMAQDGFGNQSIWMLRGERYFRTSASPRSCRRRMNP
jgi:hypothetical protein